MKRSTQFVISLSSDSESSEESTKSRLNRGAAWFDAIEIPDSNESSSDGSESSGESWIVSHSENEDASEDSDGWSAYELILTDEHRQRIRISNEHRRRLCCYHPYNSTPSRDRLLHFARRLNQGPDVPYEVGYYVPVE